MYILEKIGWGLVFLGFGLGFVRTVWVAVIAISKVARDWQLLDRKAVSDLEPSWAKITGYIAMTLMVLGVIIAFAAKK